MLKILISNFSIDENKLTRQSKIFDICLKFVGENSVKKTKKMITEYSEKR